MRRTMRIWQNTAIVQQADRDYIPRHAVLVDFCEDIFAEICEDLGIDSEYMEEIKKKECERIANAAEKKFISAP